MRKPIANILTLATHLALVLNAGADEETLKKIIWDNGEFDTVQASGSFSTSKVCGEGDDEAEELIFSIEIGLVIDPNGVRADQDLGWHSRGD